MITSPNPHDAFAYLVERILDQPHSLAAVLNTNDEIMEVATGELLIQNAPSSNWPFPASGVTGCVKMGLEFSSRSQIFVLNDGVEFAELLRSAIARS